MINFLLLSVLCVLGSAFRESGPYSARAETLLRKVKVLVGREGEESAGSSELSSGEIAGIVAGSVGFVLIVYLVYRYKTWVPKIRPARAKPTSSGESNPTSPTERLISPK